jgi:hypothetical protein
MSDLNKMLDKSNKVSLDEFASFSMDVQMRGIEKMFENEGYINEEFQPWAWEYFKGLKYGDVGSIMALADNYDINIMDMYYDHKKMIDNL